MGKMSELTVRSGRTVLLVSHNLAAVRSLCSRCLLLADGQLVLDGPVNEVVSRYAARTGVKPGRADTVFNRPPNVNLWMRQASLLSDGQTGEGIDSGSRIQVRVEFEADAALLEPRLGIVISSAIGDPLLATNNRFQQSEKLPDRPIHRGTISCDLGVLPLMPGDYTASLWLGDGGHDTHVEKDALAFRLDERDIWGRGVLPPRVAPLWWPASFRIGD
jgi:lipopolysaccharide transport system ATP-binding protein